MILQRRKYIHTKDYRRRLPLFHALSDSSLQALLSNFHINDFSSGQEIVQQAETLIFFTLSSKVVLKHCGIILKVKKPQSVCLNLTKPYMDAVLFMGGRSPLMLK